MTARLQVYHLGLQPYQPVWQAMQQFTLSRNADTPDQLWVLQHPPVYTQGLNGRAQHLLATGDIPVIPIDRGGQVTYHGPGQLVIYTLLNLPRLGLGVRSLVTLLEQAVIDELAGHGINAHARRDAPGVYVDQAKIAALGLRVRKGFSYHGLSFNIAMDLTPFQGIDPCGYHGMAVTQMRDQGIDPGIESVATNLVRRLAAALGYNAAQTMTNPHGDLPAELEALHEQNR